ncbi:MAG: amidohydrolase family protein [Tepidiformaceae bacterium]
MRSVDAHVHAFPERLALAVRERLNGEGRLTGSPLLADVAESVREGGFASAWVLPYAHRAGVAESLNEWSAREAAPFDRLVAGATFHPADGDIARLVDRALVELDLRVVKLHCAVGQFSASDGRLTPLWETASRLSVPVVVHAGQISPGETSAAEVEELEPVLTRFPGLVVVLAHSGHPATLKTVELMGRHENLYGDLTPVWDRAVEIGAVDLVKLPGRFLFGSDAPNNPVSAVRQRQRFEEMDLPTDVLSGILGGTAQALVPPR